MRKYKVVEITLKDGRKFRGVLLPTTEFSSTGIVVLKLENGYNIGIAEKNIKELKEVAQVAPAKKKIETKPPEGSADIAVLLTGGTIASSVDYVTGGVSPRLPLEDIFALVPEVFQEYSIMGIEIMRKLSEDLTPGDWIKIARAVENAWRKELRGIVVLHGTDTMHYTAAALSFMLPLGFPVVLTGAQRSADRPSTDARDNLAGAIYAAASSLGEVAINFHLSQNDGLTALIRGNRARKMHSTARAAFWPVNQRILGRVFIQKKKVELNKEAFKRHELEEFKADTKIETRVAIIKVFPGADPDVLYFYAEKGYRGIVIEATGMGHVPVAPEGIKSWIEVIRELNDSVFFAVTSQTIYGRLHRYVYTNLRRVSSVALICEDMTTEAAYAKLMWVLGHTNDLEEAKELMLRNLRGEISERTLIPFKIPEFLQ